MTTELNAEERCLQEQIAKLRQIVNAAGLDEAELELARIQSELARIQSNRLMLEATSGIEQIRAESRKREAQSWHEPLKVVIASMVLGAVLVGATIAVTKLFL